MTERDFTVPLREPGVRVRICGTAADAAATTGPTARAVRSLYGAAAVVAALSLLLSGCDTSEPTEPAGEVGSGVMDTRMPPPAPAPQPEGGR